MTGQGTIVATGAIALPAGPRRRSARTIGAEKVMTMTSTYDHRIIQGAESGQFLQVVEAYLQGEHGFYEQVFADLGAELGPAPPAPAPPAVAPRRGRRDAGSRPRRGRPAEPDQELLQAVQAAMSLIKAHRTHGHLAARLDPLGSEPEGDPALDPEPLGLTPEIMAPDPGRDPARRRPGRRRSPTRCRTCARPTAARSPTRSSTSPRTASASGCARRSRPARLPRSRWPTRRRRRCCAA